jgi:Zn-dependent M16 (insulinase) family peptidase
MPLCSLQSVLPADYFSTSAGCLTEVHHINGEGKDAGVVYSEMQGRQNQQMDLMELAKQRLMFPKGSGYRSETGGLMEALRVLQVETIREYQALIILTIND